MSNRHFVRLSAALASAALSVGLAAGLAQPASAGALEDAVTLAVALGGDPKAIIVGDYPDSAGVWQRAFYTTGVVVRRVGEPERQQVTVRYVLERRTANEVTWQWNTWTEVDSILRKATISGDAQADLGYAMFDEPERVLGTVEYRVVFDVAWQDADSHIDLFKTRVHATSQADAQCVQALHIPCVTTGSGTIWSQFRG